MSLWIVWTVVSTGILQGTAQYKTDLPLLRPSICIFSHVQPTGYRRYADETSPLKSLNRLSP